jgi:hypothetical protein
MRKLGHKIKKLSCNLILYASPTSQFTTFTAGECGLAMADLEERFAVRNGLAHSMAESYLGSCGLNQKWRFLHLATPRHKIRPLSSSSAVAH